VHALNTLGAGLFSSIEQREKKLRDSILSMAIDSPVEQSFKFGLDQVEKIYENKIPLPIILHLMEHTDPVVKAFVSRKISSFFNDLRAGDEDLFLYYAKTLLYLPSKFSPEKEYVYKQLEKYACKFPDLARNIQELLLEIGSTSVRRESERALVAFAMIQKKMKKIPSLGQ
jgi:hypothetical protein